MTCPAHTIDVALQVSIETSCLRVKIGSDSELQGTHLWILGIAWGGGAAPKGTSGQNGAAPGTILTVCVTPDECKRMSPPPVE